MSGQESSQTPPGASATETPKPSTKKHPCLLCQQRKVRCDRNEPCSNCVKAGAKKCEPVPQYPPRKRKRRFPEAELLARLRRYERHLKSYGADIEAINNEDLAADMQDTSRASESHPGSDIVNPLSVRLSLRNVENNLWKGMTPEFRDAEEFLQGSSDDEMYETPFTKTFDSIEPTEDVVLGLSPSRPSDMVHPSPVNIFQLWQAFLDNVNCLIKIFHAPSMQQKILETASNLDHIPKNFEALMFGIYSMATASMDEDQCNKLFGENRSVVLRRFQSGARQALRNAGYLRSTNLTVLQAFVLLLLSSIHFTEDPRSLFCLTGIAVRMGQRIGLATDGTHYGLLPFEAEMRRRLWWQIVVLDARTSEISGSGPGLLTYTWNTKLPMNLNDSDLFPDMRTLPAERPGLSEMTFMRLRCEVADFTQKSRSSQLTELAREGAISDFEQRIEKQYLSYCDPSIPLHFMAITMVKAAICKFRVGLHRIHPMSKRQAALPPAQKSKLFTLSLTMLENYNSVLANPSTEKYTWHILNNFPFAAYLYILCALRQKTTTEPVDRAWRAMGELADRRDALTLSTSTWKETALHYAVANMTVKAWESYETTVQQPVPIPRFISRLRHKLLHRKSQLSPQNNTTPIEKPMDMIPENEFGGQYGWFDPNAVTTDQSYDQQLMFPSTGLAAQDWGGWDGMMNIGPATLNSMDPKMPPYP